MALRMARRLEVRGRPPGRVDGRAGGQHGPTPRWSGRCRRIESASYGPLARASALSRQRCQLFKHPLTNSVALNGVLVPHESTAGFLLRKRKTVFEFQRSL
jgi:hypothetical protein